MAIYYIHLAVEKLKLKKQHNFDYIYIVSKTVFLAILDL